MQQVQWDLLNQAQSIAQRYRLPPDFCRILTKGAFSYKIVVFGSY